MSPSVEPFDEAKYKALTDGLECSEIKLSEVQKTTTLRFDSDYYKKEYLEIERFIRANKNKFITIKDKNLQVDASAFYPSLEPYYNTGTIPFVRVADVKLHIDYNSCVNIPKMNEEFRTLHLCQPGDVVLTKGGRVGTAGLITRPSYVTRDLIFINSSTMSRKDYIALYLFFSSSFAYKQMIRSSSMTAQPHLTITLIRDLLIYNYSDRFKEVIEEHYTKVEEMSLQSQQQYSQAKQLLEKALNIGDIIVPKQSVSIKGKAESFGVSSRLDAEYYQPKYDSYYAALNNFDCTSIPIEFDVFKNSGTNYEDSISDVGVIKTKQLTNSGVNTDGVESYFSKEACAQNKSTFIANNDVIFASMGVGSLGKVSLFSYDGDKQFVTDSTLRIYRAKKTARILPEVLCVFLQSTIGQELIYRYVVGSTGIINIYDDDIAKIPIPVLDEKLQKDIAVKVQDSFALRRQSKQLLEYAKQAVEMAIEQGEDAALAWLKDKVK